MTKEAERAGSLDGNIRNAEANDFLGLVDRLPALKTVAFNGGRAAKLGRKALAARRALTLIDLPSSSAAYTLSSAEKAAAWRALTCQPLIPAEAGTQV